MPQTQVSVVPGHNLVIVHSFCDGDRMVRKPRLRPETEVDALSHALWLERRGKPEQADQYLEDFLRRL